MPLWNVLSYSILWQKPCLDDTRLQCLKKLEQVWLHDYNELITCQNVYQQQLLQGATEIFKQVIECQFFEHPLSIVYPNGRLTALLEYFVTKSMLH